MATLKLELLGYPSLSLNGQPIKQQIPDKALALLSYLAVTAHPHPRDALAGLLWGNMPDDRARNNLSIVLNKVKKLGDVGDCLQISRREIGLAASQVDCDITQFDELATRPQRRSLEELETAATLYGGRFLERFRPNDEDGTRDFIDWKHGQQTRLEQLALDLFATLVQRCADTGRLSDATIYGKRLLEIDPWNESAHRQQMLLLAQNGQREQALAQYHTCAKILADELDVEPEPETTALFEEIRLNRISVQPSSTAMVPIPEDLRDRLPLRPYDDIIGRHDVIAELAELLSVDDGNWLVNLNGLGGIGKTSLAYATLRQLIRERQIGKVAWIDIDADKSQESGLSSEALLEMIVNQLIGELPAIEQHAPTIKQRLRQIKSALQAEPHLVVIDNIETFSDDGNLSEQLFELANPSRFLLVSRPQLVAVRPIQSVKLTPLNRDDTSEFVRKRAANVGLAEILASSEDAVDRLYRLVGGHPQALQLFVQCAAYFSAESILDEFESADVSDMDALYADIYERVWRTQSADARQLLDAMRLAPASGISDTLLQVYSGLDKKRLWQAIRSLVDASLLIRQSWTGEMRYHIHSLTDSFLQSRDHQQLRSDEAQMWLVEQILAATAYWQSQKEKITPATFDDQHPLLIRLVREGLKREETWERVTNLMLDLHFTIANSPYGRQWIGLHYQALEWEGSAGLYIRYRLYSRLGTHHDRFDNDTLKAISANRTALEIASEMEDLKAVGRQHVHLAGALTKDGDLELALHHGQTGLDIFEELNLPNIFIAVALNGLGVTKMSMGAFEQAAKYFERASKLEVEHASGTSMLITANSNLGIALRRLGKYEKADESLRLARNLAEKTKGFYDQIVAAYTTCHFYLDQDLLLLAENFIQSEAYDYRNESLSTTHAGYIALSFGRFYLKKGMKAQAIEHLRATVELWEDHEQLFSKGEAYALLAHAFMEESEQQLQAMMYAQKARSVFATTAIGDWELVAKQNHGFLY